MVEKKSFEIYIIFSFTLYLVVIDLIFFERLVRSKLVSIFTVHSSHSLPAKAPTLRGSASRRFFYELREFCINCRDLWNFSPYQELKMHIRKVIPESSSLGKIWACSPFFWTSERHTPKEGILWIVADNDVIQNSLQIHSPTHSHIHTHTHSHETLFEGIFCNSVVAHAAKAHFVAENFIIWCTRAQSESLKTFTQHWKVSIFALSIWTKNELK
jgi:hypothetical protein